MTVENIDSALVVSLAAIFLLWCLCMYRKHSRKLTYEEYKARMIALNIGTGKHFCRMCLNGDHSQHDESIWALGCQNPDCECINETWRMN